MISYSWEGSLPHHGEQRTVEAPEDAPPRPTGRQAPHPAASFGSGGPAEPWWKATAGPSSGQLTDVGSGPEKVSALFTVTRPGSREAGHSRQDFGAGWIPRSPPGSASAAMRNQPWTQGATSGTKSGLSCSFEPAQPCHRQGLLRDPSVPVSLHKLTILRLGFTCLVV